MKKAEPQETTISPAELRLIQRLRKMAHDSHRPTEVLIRVTREPAGYRYALGEFVPRGRFYL